MIAGNEAFDSYSSALAWLVEYNNLLAEDYEVEPIVNGHFFYNKLGDLTPTRSVWLEPVD